MGTQCSLPSNPTYLFPFSQDATTTRNTQVAIKRMSAFLSHLWPLVELFIKLTRPKSQPQSINVQISPTNFKTALTTFNF